MSEHSQVEKVVIIGSGPAGYTAALYAARADLNPLLFAGWQPGGQLTITTDVENYPGFPDGIMGPELTELFRVQAARFGARIKDSTVTKLDLSSRPFRVTAEGTEVLAESVILSTGASAKWLGLPTEQTFGGYGVSACATCDGFFFRNKEVIVVGGGDTALEEASYLTKHCSKVYLIHRREDFRASRIMVDRVKKNPKIELVLNTVLEEILGDTEPVKKVHSVRLKNLKSGETYTKPIQGVFIAIGHEPNSQLVRGMLDVDDVGYVKTVPGSTKTNVTGVFAAGDVADSIFRQAITAAGTGCMAAIEAERYLSELGSEPALAAV